MTENKHKNNVTLINHPLISDKLTRIRNIKTENKIFRENLDEIASLMAYEVFANLPLETVAIETPVAKTIGKKLTKQIIFCPILRAGLGLVSGLMKLVPTAAVSHIGLYRDEVTLQPHEYYFKFPEFKSANEALVYILDPMLATGGSALAAIEKLKSIGIKNINLVVLVGVEQALTRITKKHPDVKIYLAAIDEKLNENGYIVPGLGDAGDRIFGTK